MICGYSQLNVGRRTALLKNSKLALFKGRVSLLEITLASEYSDWLKHEPEKFKLIIPCNRYGCDWSWIS